MDLATSFFQESRFESWHTGVFRKPTARRDDARKAHGPCGHRTRLLSQTIHRVPATDAEPLQVATTYPLRLISSSTCQTCRICRRSRPSASVHISLHRSWWRPASTRRCPGRVVSMSISRTSHRLSVQCFLEACQPRCEAACTRLWPCVRLPTLKEDPSAPAFTPRPPLSSSAGPWIPAKTTPRN
jgi:hypothetical protein